MTFATLHDLIQRLSELGARQVLVKPLAENDNTKQQVYLGGSFESLNLLPYREVRSGSDGSPQTLKAALDLRWIDAAGHVEPAPHAKLILYPRYPEVRLSGFLRGCRIAPAALMQPVPRMERAHHNANDGRVLFLGVGDNGALYAYIAAAGSAVSVEFQALAARPDTKQIGVFFVLGTSTRGALLSRLRQIHVEGWHVSKRLDKEGRTVPYAARNGGGYTLEALLGVKPNGRAEPDYMGWEIKAYGSDRITLMTPEPDTGFYGDHGVQAFVRRYGHVSGDDVLYFTGLHRVGTTCHGSGQTLRIRGFDASSRKITDVTGGVELVDRDGEVSAGWSFTSLLEHWGRKHALAAYVPYSSRTGSSPEYRYTSPVLLGEGTEFTRFLHAMSRRIVCYDPGSKIERAGTSKPRVKARSQFRIGVSGLRDLYHRMDAVTL